MRIITRAEVGYRPPKKTSRHRRIEGLIWHWVGNERMSRNPSEAEVKSTLRGIQRYEMNQKDYSDIAYSYMIDPAGRVYEARTDRVMQAASNKYNSKTFAICYVGGPGVPFTAAAQRAGVELVGWLKGRHSGISYNWPHSKVRPGGTACPGDQIRAWLVSGLKITGGGAPAPAPSGGGGGGSGLLRQGSKGNTVKAWQRDLVEYSGQRIVADGDFGPNTAQATRNFQSFWKLDADGIVGPKTLAMMAYTKAVIKARKPAPMDTNAWVQIANAIERIKTSNVREGSSGAEVKLVQALLEQRGYDVGDIDSQFGPKTEAAVKRFQRDRKLKTDGIVGRKTIEALLAKR